LSQLRALVPLLVAFPFWLIASPARVDCGYKRELIPGETEYTNDFYFTSSSEEGAPGEVVGVDLSLTVEASHGLGLYAFGLVASYDGKRGAILGEPVYSDRFWDFGFSPFFFELPDVDGKKGFIIISTVRPDDSNGFIGSAIPIGKLYFKLLGEIGESFEVKFVDDVFMPALDVPMCLRNQLSYFQKFAAYSNRHVSGLVRIVDGESVTADPPPLAPDAKVYTEESTDEAVGARYELSAGSGTGKLGAVTADLYITSRYDFVGYIVGGKFPSEYLNLERVEVLTTPGAELMDNQKGEFGIYSSNSRRRIGAEDERVHAARLHFSIKEAALGVDRVTISLEDLSLGPYGVKSYVNRVRILRTDAAGGVVPATVEVSPMVLGRVVLGVSSLTRTARGDANFDHRINLSDAVNIIGYLYSGTPMECALAADVNVDGRVDLGDALEVLRDLFLGSNPEADWTARVPCR
jgi:dockerin type I repeat protein